MEAIVWQVSISALLFAAVALGVYRGGPAGTALLGRQRRWLDRVLNRQLLLAVDSRIALGLVWGSGVGGGVLLGLLIGGLIAFLVGAALGFTLPVLVLRHLEQKRAQRLDEQLVDGLTTLASAVRAGLNLVQAIELLVQNAADPLRAEFQQLLREYRMGLELGQAMRNAADRIGLQNYRLVFTAIQMHRQRGGDTAESLDRIADSVREIQRLEGKLEALTAQGRAQARFMGVMPLVMLAIFYVIDPQGVKLLFVEPMGRVLLLIAAGLVAIGFVWIRRIMAVDI
jgi:tight adherence protein B